MADKKLLGVVLGAAAVGGILGLLSRRKSAQVSPYQGRTTPTNDELDQVNRALGVTSGAVEPSFPTATFIGHTPKDLSSVSSGTFTTGRNILSIRGTINERKKYIREYHYKNCTKRILGIRYCVPDWVADPGWMGCGAPCGKDFLSDGDGERWTKADGLVEVYHLIPTSKSNNPDVGMMVCANPHDPLCLETVSKYYKIGLLVGTTPLKDGKFSVYSLRPGFYHVVLDSDNWPDFKRWPIETDKDCMVSYPGTSGARDQKERWRNKNFEIVSDTHRITDDWDFYSFGGAKTKTIKCR